MSTHISVPPQLLLERILTLEIVRVTERAAVSAARLRGHGNEKAADQAAVDAMRRELNKLPIEGTVVIGEGERDEAPMLFIGEKVGFNAGPQVDIAVDPLEGTTLCAKNMPGAIATMAMADGGTLLHAPDVYMQKIAVGPGYPKASSNSTHRRPTMFVGSPRPRASMPPRSRCWCSTARVTPKSSHGVRSHRRGGPPHHRRRRGGRDPLRRSRQYRGRHVYRHRRRARGRAGGGGAALHRRPDAVPADPRHRGEARARPQDGRQRSAHDLRHRGHGEGRLPVRGDRRHRRVRCSRASSSARM